MLNLRFQIAECQGAPVDNFMFIRDRDIIRNANKYMIIFIFSQIIVNLFLVNEAENLLQFTL